jgi:hypothetical protein
MNAFFSFDFLWLIGQKMSDMSITVIYNATEPNAVKFVED